MREPADGDVTARLARLAAAFVVTLALSAGAVGSTAATAAPVDEAPAAPAADTDPTRAAAYWLDDHGVREAWKTAKGKGVTIAVIDTGIGRTPVEFAGAVAGG
ncbi:hypothetical protein [Escherichia coli]|uniref:hypothetical protein n=1 Tax=Escherichia coli TaxID=562 RepID=UPI001930EEC6|nr:hypothetical protein [Escherichia coli]